MEDDDARSTDPRVVLVHGIRASSSAWDRLLRRALNDPELAKLTFHAFEYPSPTFDLARTSPTQREVALKLHSYVESSIPKGVPLVLIGHSQGGLVLQHWLVRKLLDGQGLDLARVRALVLLACPNNGSEYLKSLRRVFKTFSSRQFPQLAVLDAEINEMQQRMLERVAYAHAITPTTCLIPVYSYAAESDKIVRSPSAFGGYADRGVLTAITRPSSTSIRAT